MSQTMRVVIKRIDAPAAVEDLDLPAGTPHGEATYEAILDALKCEMIETVCVGPGVDLVCDEDGIANDAAFNECGIRGAFLLVGFDVGAGDFRSLTAEETRKALAWCARHRDQPHREGFVVEDFGSDELYQEAVSRIAEEQWAGWDSL